jgi:hypothetical protein
MGAKPVFHYLPITEDQLACGSYIPPAATEFINAQATLHVNA